MKLLITTLLLPLGLVLVLLGAGLFFLVRRPYGRPAMVPGKGLMCMGLALAVLLFSAMPVVGRGLSTLLVNQVAGRSLTMPDQAGAIIVLTGNMVPVGPLGFLPTKESIHRLAVAYELQNLLGGRIPIIISGGHTHGVQNPSEARVVAEFFAQARSQITPVELEEASTNTDESAAQLASILAKRGNPEVFLITDDVHMLRALATFRARGIDPIPFPALSLGAPQGVRDFLPSVRGLAATHAAVYEVYGLAAYLLAGKINWGDVFYTPAAATED